MELKPRKKLKDSWEKAINETKEQQRNREKSIRQLILPDDSGQLINTINVKKRIGAWEQVFEQVAATTEQKEEQMRQVNIAAASKIDNAKKVFTASDAAMYQEISIETFIAGDTHVYHISLLEEYVQVFLQQSLSKSNQKHLSLSCGVYADAEQIKPPLVAYAAAIRVDVGQESESIYTALTIKPIPGRENDPDALGVKKISIFSKDLNGSILERTVMLVSPSSDTVSRSRENTSDEKQLMTIAESRNNKSTTVSPPKKSADAPLKKISKASPTAASPTPRSSRLVSWSMDSEQNEQPHMGGTDESSCILPRKWNSFSGDVSDTTVGTIHKNSGVEGLKVNIGQEGNVSVPESFIIGDTHSYIAMFLPNHYLTFLTKSLELVQAESETSENSSKIQLSCGILAERGVKPLLAANAVAFKDDRSNVYISLTIRAVDGHESDPALYGVKKVVIFARELDGNILERVLDITPSRKENSTSEEKTRRRNTTMTVSFQPSEHLMISSNSSELDVLKSSPKSPSIDLAPKKFLNEERAHLDIKNLEQELSNTKQELQESRKENEMLRSQLHETQLGANVMMESYETKIQSLQLEVDRFHQEVVQNNAKNVGLETNRPSMGSFVLTAPSRVAAIRDMFSQPGSGNTTPRFPDSTAPIANDVGGLKYNVKSPQPNRNLLVYTNVIRHLKGMLDVAKSTGSSLASDYHYEDLYLRTLNFELKIKRIEELIRLKLTEVNGNERVLSEVEAELESLKAQQHKSLTTMAAQEKKKEELMKKSIDLQEKHRYEIQIVKSLKENIVNVERKVLELQLLLTKSKENMIKASLESQSYESHLKSMQNTPGVNSNKFVDITMAAGDLHSTVVLLNTEISEMNVLMNEKRDEYKTMKRDLKRRDSLLRSLQDEMTATSYSLSNIASRSNKYLEQLQNIEKDLTTTAQRKGRYFYKVEEGRKQVMRMEDEELLPLVEEFKRAKLDHQNYIQTSKYTFPNDFSADVTADQHQTNAEESGDMGGQECHNIEEQFSEFFEFYFNILNNHRKFEIENKHLAEKVKSMETEFEMHRYDTDVMKTTIRQELKEKRKKINDLKRLLIRAKEKIEKYSSREMSQTGYQNTNSSVMGSKSIRSYMDDQLSVKSRNQNESVSLQSLILASEKNKRNPLLQMSRLSINRKSLSTIIDDAPDTLSRRNSTRMSEMGEGHLKMKSSSELDGESLTFSDCEDDDASSVTLPDCFKKSLNDPKSPSQKNLDSLHPSGEMMYVTPQVDRTRSYSNEAHSSSAVTNEMNFMVMNPGYNSSDFKNHSNSISGNDATLNNAHLDPMSEAKSFHKNSQSPKKESQIKILSEADYSQRLRNFSTDSDVQDQPFHASNRIESVEESEKAPKASLSSNIVKAYSYIRSSVWNRASESKEKKLEVHLTEDMMKISLEHIPSLDDYSISYDSNTILLKEIMKLAAKDPSLLVGWQISVLDNVIVTKGVYIITGVRKNRKRQAEYCLSSFNREDLWVKLERGESKPGVAFIPIRKVLNG